jgi:NADPH-dependent ferric siderophore reductase
MARTNMAQTRIKPAHSELLTLRVLRRHNLSPHFTRVTLGGGDISRFTYMGYDQWFRLFIPVADNTLSRLPNKLDTLSYLKFLTISKKTRPVLRNYTVRSYRPDGEHGPELDIDFVLHGSPADNTAGPAATWAQTCEENDPVAILDEGISFNPDPSLRRVLLVADESALAATAGILASLADDFHGEAIIEIPTLADQQPLPAPKNVTITWQPRDDEHATPGRKALAAAQALTLPAEPFYAWTAGESTLPATLRRHWIANGVAKENIYFCGYWKATAH